MANKLKFYFTKSDIILWSSSVTLIFLSYIIFNKGEYLTLIASLLGVTALIFTARGNAFGNLIMVVFCILYGFISYTFAYYGEMITYLGMSLPMAVFAFISWLRNPYEGNRAEVKVNSLSRGECVFMWILSGFVTVAFYFILKYFGTANLIPSTLSVLTSFLAAYLIFRRSPTFALAYATNDVVLIVLWVLASIKDVRYVSVVVCFVTFLANDLYNYLCWKKMKARQSENK